MSMSSKNLKYVTVLSAIAVMIILALAGCGDKATTGNAEVSPRNIILITVDTTRADYIGCYGNKVVKTPVIDSLAAESVVFDRDISTAHSTAPSHASILTSLYLKDHGVYDNFTRLPDDPFFLARVMKKRGYNTAGFTSMKSLSKEHNYDQGFDFFSCDYRKAEKTNAELLPWLEKNAKNNNFIWVHYYDPHTPYTPPEPFKGFYNFTSDVRIDFSYKAKGEESLLKYFTLSEDPEYYRNLYKGEISYMDFEIGKVLTLLKKLGLYDDTMIVMVADHGENMGDHDLYFGHGSLYDTTVHVPLIIKMPGQKYVGKRPQLVSSLDVYPTILEEAGAHVAGKIRGVSLMNIIKDKDAPSPRTEAYSEHYSYDPQLRITTEDFLLMKNLEKSRYGKKNELQLYSVKGDPGQTDNLVNSKPEIARELSEKLASFRKDKIPLGEAYKVHDEKLEKELKALGYVQ